MWYYQDIKLSNISSTFAYANEEKPITMDADFMWGKSNDYATFKNHANITCRFTSTGDSPTVVIQGGLMEATPLGEYLANKLPNQIRCRTPKLSNTGKIKMDVSINGIDYTGNFEINIVEALNIQKISPISGPIEGGTKIKLYGSGFDASLPKEKEVYIRFGTLEHQLLDKSGVKQSETWNENTYYDQELNMPKAMLHEAEE